MSSSLSPEAFLLIIGAMKSGTTTLFDLLSQHPEICAASAKEPNYFCEAATESRRRQYLSGWDWDHSISKYAMEASVAYTKWPAVKGVPENIKTQCMGQYKFIYIVRNPFDRIESHVRHGLFAGWGKSLDQEFPEEALEYSRYATQIARYASCFNSSDILVLPMEDLQHAPEATMHRVCQFLEIDSSFVFKELGTKSNSGEIFDSPRFVALLTQNRISQFFVQTFLSQRAKRNVRRLIAKLFSDGKKSNNFGRYRLSETEKNNIRRELADDLAKLHQIYGVHCDELWGIPLPKGSDISQK